jgi:hypothetical protein
MQHVCVKDLGNEIERFFLQERGDRDVWTGESSLQRIRSHCLVRRWTRVVLYKKHAFDVMIFNFSNFDLLFNMQPKLVLRSGYD